MSQSTTVTIGAAAAAAVLVAAGASGAPAVRAVAGPAASPAAPAPPDTVVRRDLSVEEAVREALEGNAELEGSRLREGMAGAGVRRARSALMPRVELISGWQRTTDPVGAFGTKLRQGRFGREDLAVDALNEPDPITDWSSAVELGWSVLDPARWAERSAASSRAAAARWRAERTREGTEYRARALYYRAARAEAEVAAARAAERTAEANVDLFRERREEGLLTDADVLQAEAELEAARAGRIDARRRLRDARERLGLFLGWSPDSVPVAADSLSPPTSPDTAGAYRPERRSDLRAREAAIAAARAEEDAAWRAYLPTLEAFGRYSLHDRDGPLGADGDHWSVGVQLRWTLFAGLGRAAARRRADLAAQEARLEYSAAVREATAEARRARRAVESARRRVEATRSARRAAERGRDLTRRRFEEGLAIASDVLQAEGRVVEMRSRAIQALAAYRIALARLRFARTQGGAPGAPRSEADGTGGETVNRENQHSSGEGR